MGTWGFKIFEDDLALDVKEAFTSLLHDGLTSEAATARVCEEFSASRKDADEHDVFWLALAEHQWDLGRLQRDVLNTAQAILAKVPDADRWGDLLAGRTRELKRLQKKLDKAAPKQKRLIKREPKLEPGDVFCFSPPDNRALVLYGRHLTQFHQLYYDFQAGHEAINNRVIQAFASSRTGHGEPDQVNREFELNDVLNMSPAFVASCMDGFWRHKFRVLGNVPLEAKLLLPIQLYDRAVGTDVCRVYDLWHPENKVDVHVRDLPVSTTRASFVTFETILLKLGIPAEFPSP